jgi:carbon monoxide dehydrogenase subunit G
MQLVNEFVVPRGVDETWAVLTDVERIAPAMPGAQLTEVSDDGQYHGTVKVKVGPVTAKYGGVASFRELDKPNRHMVLDATGKESSGRGRASALVSADLIAEGTDTRVRVTTDLTISGPLAQFGRGAIAEVSTRLLNQFVDNLKQTVLADGAAAAAAAGSTSGGAPVTEAAPADSTTATTSPAPAASTTIVEPTSSGAPVPVPQTRAAPPAPVSSARPVDSVPAAEVNLLRIAAWPILKRVLPAVTAVAVVVVVLVWVFGRNGRS